MWRCRIGGLTPSLCSLFEKKEKCFWVRPSLMGLADCRTNDADNELRVQVELYRLLSFARKVGSYGKR